MIPPGKDRAGTPHSAVQLWSTGATRIPSAGVEGMSSLQDLTSNWVFQDAFHNARPCLVFWWVTVPFTIWSWYFHCYLGYSGFPRLFALAVLPRTPTFSLWPPGPLTPATVVISTSMALFSFPQPSWAPLSSFHLKPLLFSIEISQMPPAVCSLHVLPRS